MTTAALMCLSGLSADSPPPPPPHKLSPHRSPITLSLDAGRQADKLLDLAQDLGMCDSYIDHSELVGILAEARDKTCQWYEVERKKTWRKVRSRACSRCGRGACGVVLPSGIRLYWNGWWFHYGQ